MQHKKLHNLTRIGRQEDRRHYFRRDANCPAVVAMSTRDTQGQFSAGGLVVNISEQGCLITSGAFPWRDDVLDAGSDAPAGFPRIAEHVQIFLPWTGTTIGAVIKEQGNYTLRLQFVTLMPELLVDRIARMTPARPVSAAALRA
ncbi:hypothetical protein DFR52_102326 [Hoeflea marina]|uniref:PilZ domain-containing protein n=1 Tax=Hoeflea marina TaxID=274592 RepID=A0A317PMC1_9HYPH|nr:hypothetical protein [Hoeflea marina]PWW01663.1 hypothetical protein DFR52_102326 [Hoeflea marina]